MRITQHGPLFDGRAQAALKDYIEDVEAEVAQEGEQLVHKYLHEFLQHPTGRYESHVRARARGSLYEVSDGGVVYGPWLAGTGSRNAPRTRFRGYRHWVLAFQELERSSGRIAERVFRPYLRRMQ
ncbi:hypothetical protein ACFWA4_05905 [Streptomyces sp. NPDC060011]|uniref:hypothetical protein n=1 Tax=Streptomyces sp. NPDC060011 TaxID=3347037 RepID=UPI0036CD2E50